MLQNKMLQWLIIILIAITLITLASFVLWDYMERRNGPANLTDQAIQSVSDVKGKQPSAQQIREMTVMLNDLLTNLSNNQFVKISFAFELDSKKAKTEFEQMDYRIKAIAIRTLADMSADQIRGSQGHDALSAALLNQINPLLTQGKLRQIHITDFALN